MRENLQQTQSEEEIIVDWDFKDDFMANYLLANEKITIEEFLDLPQVKIFSITRSQIENFCGKCDSFKGEDPCHCGFQNQTRYVARQWCGWTMVGGQRGEMTSDGFKGK